MAPSTLTLLQNEPDRLTPGMVPPDIPAADRGAVERALANGYLAGYRAVMYTSADISFGAALIALVFLPPKARAVSAAA